MSDRTRDFGRASFFGRKLEEEQVGREYVGTVGPLVRARKDVLKFVRKHAEEIPDTGAPAPEGRGLRAPQDGNSLRGDDDVRRLSGRRERRPALHGPRRAARSAHRGRA
jgi:hypothetical protein